jgi:hypothetical protein
MHAIGSWKHKPWLMDEQEDGGISLWSQLWALWIPFSMHLKQRWIAPMLLSQFRWDSDLSMTPSPSHSLVDFRVHSPLTVTAGDIRLAGFQVQSQRQDFWQRYAICEGQIPIRPDFVLNESAVVVSKRDSCKRKLQKFRQRQPAICWGHG